jgi:hypothetical protein
MALLQALAARMAGLDHLVLHTGSAGGRTPLDDALRLSRDDLATGGMIETTKLVERIAAIGFEWGVSDGN